MCLERTKSVSFQQDDEKCFIIRNAVNSSFHSQEESILLFFMYSGGRTSENSVACIKIVNKNFTEFTWRLEQWIQEKRAGFLSVSVFLQLLLPFAEHHEQRLLGLSPRNWENLGEP